MPRLTRSHALYSCATHKRNWHKESIGAGPATLFHLLSKEFLLLVGIAIVIASPLAWLSMNNWLEDYVYRIDVSWWMFVVAGGATIFIALLTVSFHALKTAMVNPVKSLRIE